MDADALNAPSVRARVRRRAVRVMLAVPTVAFAVLTIFYTAGQGLDRVWRGAWFVGCMLCGPWAESAIRSSDSWTFALLAWSVLFGLTAIARRTRLGDAHWGIYVAIVVAWMLIGLREFGRIG